MTQENTDFGMSTRINDFPDNNCTLLLKCNYCLRQLDSTKNDSSREYTNLGGMPNNLNDNVCFGCGQYLSKCAVCSFPITIHINSKIRKVSSTNTLGNGGYEEKNMVNELYAFCTKCHHGGHFDHYRDWFQEFNQCPFYNCECMCKDTYN